MYYKNSNILDAINYINQNIDNNIVIEEVASVSGLLTFNPKKYSQELFPHFME